MIASEMNSSVSRKDIAQRLVVFWMLNQMDNLLNLFKEHFIFFPELGEGLLEFIAELDCIHLQPFEVVDCILLAEFPYPFALLHPPFYGLVPFQIPQEHFLPHDVQDELLDVLVPE